MGARQFIFLLKVFLVLSLLAGACGREKPLPTAAPGQAPAVQTAAPAAPAPAATPLPAPTREYRPEMTICLTQEPESLFLPEAGSTAALQILSALYDPGVEWVDMIPHPLLLRLLPSQENGDLRVEWGGIEDGQLYYDRVLDRLRAWDEGTSTLPYTVAYFRLEEGIAWSDGTPLTAGDSVYAYELDKSQNGWLAQITASYRAVDDYTVEWTSLPGYAGVDSEVFTFFWTPMPGHKRDEIAASQDQFARSPLSYGPFVFSEWQPGEQIRLVRNPDYWLGPHLPYLEAVTFRFVSSSEQALYLLQNGECDLIPPGTLRWEDIPLLQQMAETDWIEPLVVPSGRWEHIDFGIRDPNGNDRKLADLRVRQAIAHGVNRQEMAENILYGQAPVMASYQPPELNLWREDDCIVNTVLNELQLPPPGTFDPQFYPLDWALEPGRWSGYDKSVCKPDTEPEWGDLDQYTYDPEKARQLLAEAGIGQGELTLSYLTTENNPMRAQIAQQFQHDMTAIGINVVIQPVSLNTLLTLFNQRAFDLAEYSWDVSAPRPQCQFYHSQNSGNAAGYGNPYFDKACQTALNAAEPLQAYVGHALALHLFTAELPALPLFQRLEVGAMRQEVVGFAANSGPPARALWNLRALRVLAEPGQPAASVSQDAVVPAAWPAGVENDRAQQEQWIVLILKDVTILEPDEDPDETMIITRVSGKGSDGKQRVIERKWPDTNWVETKGKTAQPYNVDIPIYWGPEPAEEQELQVTVTVLDNDEGELWIKKYVAAGSKVLKVIDTLAQKRLTKTLTGLGAEHLEKLSATIGANDIVAVLEGPLNATQAFQHQRCKGQAVCEIPRSAGNKVDFTFALHRVVNQACGEPQSITGISIPRIKIIDPGDSSSGNIYGRGDWRTANREVSGHIPLDGKHVFMPVGARSTHKVSANETWATDRFLNTGNPFLFLYLEMGVWDYDSLSNDDMLGFYSKTLRWGEHIIENEDTKCWWTEDIKEISQPQTVAGIDEGEVTITFEVK